jgi:hypothetical protein
MRVLSLVETKRVSGAGAPAGPNIKPNSTTTQGGNTTSVFTVGGTTVVFTCPAALSVGVNFEVSTTGKIVSIAGGVETSLPATCTTQTTFSNGVTIINNGKSIETFDGNGKHIESVKISSNDADYAGYDAMVTGYNGSGSAPPTEDGFDYDTAFG